jgi:hypothetical protein
MADQGSGEKPNPPKPPPPKLQVIPVNPKKIVKSGGKEPKKKG